MRRRVTVITATAAAVGAIFAPTAAAKSPCSVPDHPAWHSCLSAGHRPVVGTDQVRLTRASATLVVRSAACPPQLIRRTVALRTRKGQLLARKRVTGRCRNGVSRWRTNLRPNLDLARGTVVRSFWSRLADEDQAPSVKLED